MAGGSTTEDTRIPHKYNRLLVYRSNLMHTATRYWGATLTDKRMAAVFFWMACDGAIKKSPGACASGDGVFTEQIRPVPPSRDGTGVGLTASRCPSG